MLDPVQGMHERCGSHSAVRTPFRHDNHLPFITSRRAVWPDRFPDQLRSTVNLPRTVPVARPPRADSRNGMFSTPTFGRFGSRSAIFVRFAGTR